MYIHGEPASNIQQDEEGTGYGFTLANECSIIHRIDCCLVPTVGAIYSISLMDRTNSAADITGMSESYRIPLCKLSIPDSCLLSLTWGLRFYLSTL